MRASLLAMFVAATSTAAPAIAASSARTPASDGSWFAWGGRTRIEFNPDALRRFDLAIERVDGALERVPGVPGRRYDASEFAALAASDLQLNHRGAVPSGIGGGALRHAGGLVLRHRGEVLDLRGFALRASPDTRFGLDLVDAHGRTWFTADHAHYGFEGDARDVFAMRHMNLRLAPRLAALLGARAGTAVGGLDLHASTSAALAPAPGGGVCDAPWPSPGNPAGISMIYGAATWTGWSDSVYVKRDSGDCTPTSTDCRIVVNADPSLRNSGATAVAWYEKFNRDQPGAEGVPQPPYGNDQHPYLIWNLYRIDAAGRIRQIGASGAKHAFYTSASAAPIPAARRAT